MATQAEIKKHLEIALKEIGEIQPWFDEEVDAWIFWHRLYPVEYGGKTRAEVIRNYPKYLREFIKHRLNDNLAPFVEKRTKGHGGKRIGAGRPKGTKKEQKERVSLPKDIAKWIKRPESVRIIRQMMSTKSKQKK